jgi:hypothetical protein
LNWITPSGQPDRSIPLGEDPHVSATEENSAARAIAEGTSVGITDQVMALARNMDLVQKGFSIEQIQQLRPGKKQPPLVQSHGNWYVPKGEETADLDFAKSMTAEMVTVGQDGYGRPQPQAAVVNLQKGQKPKVEVREPKPQEMVTVGDDDDAGPPERLQKDAVQKSIEQDDGVDVNEPLSKSDMLHGGGRSWADQFQGTPLYSEALKCEEDSLEREIELRRRKRAQRQQDDQRKASAGRDEKAWNAIYEIEEQGRAEYDQAKEDLALKLVRHRRSEEELYQEQRRLREGMSKSRTPFDSLQKAIDEAEKAQPSASADVTPEKARKILHDGSVRGHPLTEQQRKMFGAIASRGKKVEKAEGPPPVKKPPDAPKATLQKPEMTDEQKKVAAELRAARKSLSIGAAILEDHLEKSGEWFAKAEGGGHKYIRRTGMPGSYQYEYAEAEGPKPAHSAEDMVSGKGPYKPGETLSHLHDSPETAHVIADYPYGSHRTEKRVWVESHPKKGQRAMSQTKNPKTGLWNKPDASVYHDAHVLHVDDVGHVKHDAFSLAYTSGATAQKFLDEHKDGIAPDRLAKIQFRIDYDKLMDAKKKEAEEKGGKLEYGTPEYAAAHKESMSAAMHSSGQLEQMKQEGAKEAEAAKEKKAAKKEKAAEAKHARVTYEAAMGEFRTASSKHSEVTAAYRAKKVGDAEFLASKKALDAASKKADAAEALVKKSMDPFKDFLAKAEGERGGKIIGHSAGGKPIYEPHADAVARMREHVNLQKKTAKGKLAEHAADHLHRTSKDFSPADHADAAKEHKKEASDHSKSEKVRAFHQAISEAHDAKASNKATPAAAARAKADASAAKREASAKKKEEARPKQTIATTSGGHEIKNTHHIRDSAAGTSLNEGPASSAKGTVNTPIETEMGPHLSPEQHRDIAQHHKDQAHAHAAKHDRDKGPTMRISPTRVERFGEHGTKIRQHEHAAELHEAAAKLKEAAPKGQAGFAFKSFGRWYDSLIKSGEDKERAMTQGFSDLDNWLQKAGDRVVNDGEDRVSVGRAGSPANTGAPGVGTEDLEYDGDMTSGNGSRTMEGRTSIEKEGEPADTGVTAGYGSEHDLEGDDGQDRGMTDRTTVDSPGSPANTGAPSISSEDLEHPSMSKAHQGSMGLDPDDPMEAMVKNEDEEEGDDEDEEKAMTKADHILDGGEHARAAIISQLQKSRDVFVGYGQEGDSTLPSFQKSRPEVEKPSYWMQKGGSMLYSDQEDKLIERNLNMVDDLNFYQTPKLELESQLQKSHECPLCKSLTPVTLSDCQNCGHMVMGGDVAVTGTGGAMILEKAVAMTLIPPDLDDVFVR